MHSSPTLLVQKKNSRKPKEVPTNLSTDGLTSDLPKKSSLEKMPFAPMRLRREEALARLKVKPEQLEKVPNITAILKETHGGLKIAFKAMRFSRDPLIHAFLKKYDSIPLGDRDRVPIEAIAIAAKIDISHFWGELMLAIREHSVSAVKLIAVSSHPEVMKSRVEFAKLAGGTRDRDALDTMLGALPSPKGPTFIGKFFAGNSKDPDDIPEAPAELVDDLDYIFPDAEVMQERIQPMRQKLLETRK